MSENNESKIELQQYSKKFHQKERDKTAQNVALIRKNYFSEKRANIDQKQQLLQETSEKEKSIDLKISEKELRLENKKQTWILKLYNFLTIQKIKTEIDTLQKDKLNYEQQYQELEAIILQIDAANGELKEIKNRNSQRLLEEFYSDQQRKLEKYRDYSQIKNISIKNNCIFIHGIKAGEDRGRVQENNKVVGSGSWKTFLGITAHLKPTISTSTIRLDEQSSTQDKSWYPFGVFLSKGNVVEAHEQDAGSQAFSLDTRKSSRYQNNSLDQEIIKAINKPYSKGYNEINVQNPQVAGIYYCPEEMDKAQSISIKEIFDFAKEYNIPAYSMVKGKIYHGNQKVGLQEILDHTVSEKTARSIFEKQIDIECPFKLPCFVFINSFAQGSINYALFNHEKIKNIQKKGKVLLKVNDIGNTTEIIDPEKVSDDKSYFKKNSLRFYNYSIGDQGETRDKSETTGYLGYNNLNQTERDITIDRSIGWFKADRLENNKDYIDEVEKMIIMFSNKISKSVKEREKINYATKRMLFNIYGYATSAKKFNDNDTYEYALSIITKYATRGELDAIIDLFNQDNGKFSASEQLIRDQVKYKELLNS